MPCVPASSKLQGVQYSQIPNLPGTLLVNEAVHALSLQEQKGCAAEAGAQSRQARLRARAGPPARSETLPLSVPGPLVQAGKG